MEGDEYSQYKPCRAELNSPNTDWALTWKLCRLQGFGSEQTSFNFKLLHGLCVTKVRLHEITPTTSLMFTVHSGKKDLQHAFFNCEFNGGVGQRLLLTARRILPSVSGPALLRLELQDLSESCEYANTFLITSILRLIWDKRMTQSRITLYEIRATLEAKCLLLRETRFALHAPLLEDMLKNL